MRTSKISLILCLTGLLCAAKLNAGTAPDPGAIFVKSRDLLKQGKYQALETLVSDIRKKGYDVRDSWPELLAFYGSFEMNGNADEAQWEARRKLIENWTTAFPDSIAAKIALADWWIGYGWKSRGTGYADSVSGNGWKDLADRVGKAAGILKSVPEEKVDDPEYYRMWIMLCLGGGLPPEQMEGWFKKGVALAKDYYPLYRDKAYYLLPRWYGEEGQREAFDTEAANSFPAEKGDTLYAYLAREDAHYSDDDFFTTQKVDYERVKRGYLLELARSHDTSTFRNQDDFCYLAAIKGDNETAVKLFLDLGDYANFPSFGGKEKFLALRKKSGAQAALDSAEAAERAGNVAQARKTLEGNSLLPAYSYTLFLFYGRQGLEKELRTTRLYVDGKLGTEVLDLDPAKANPDELADMSRLFAMLGKWDKAEASAQKFDQLRPWNLTGKYILLLCAAHRGDAVLAESIRKEIADMKTDRAAYKIAQSVLSGGKTAQDVLESLKGNDPYLCHAAEAIAFYNLSQGKGDVADSVLESALPTCPSLEDQALMESVLYGALSRALKPPAGGH